VKKLWAWLAGGAGGVAAYRTLKRRTPEPVPVPDTRVDELRAMLAEKREQPASAEDADSRRRAVHEQARAAIDEMLGE
jgi:hypothetical protein